ncbi:MAG: hypothetical protein ACKV19_04915 [Verrucomicrobiales bacterium]
MTPIPNSLDLAAPPLPSSLHLILVSSWIGLLLGVFSGALLGLFFHRDDFMGGYQSFRRRLARLGHISFFGLAFLNFFFVLTAVLLGFDEARARPAALALLLGAATMPTVCFLTAWKKPFRHLFFIPVGGVAIGIVLTLRHLIPSAS